MGLPPVVVGLAVYLLLSRSGPLGALGWLFTPRAMILAQVILVLPLVTGLTAAAVAAVPAELFIQVVGLGASRRQARLAVLREARPGVLAAIAAGFGRSASEVGAVLIVGGNIAGRTRVLTTAIVLETGKGDFAAALALGGVLLALAFLANLAILRLQGRWLP
jgi:tungstate transport system permease protein